MSSQLALPTSANKMPVWNWSVSWNRESALLNGEFAEWSKRLGEEAFAGLRILVVMLLAVSAEWHLAPLAFAGGAPLPILPSVIACYVLSGSFGRMIVACVLAGTLRDAFSPAMPFGCSGLIFLFTAVVARELCDRRERITPTEEFLVGALVAGGIMLLSHGVLVSTGVHGSVDPGVLPRRVLGSAFAAGLVIVPLTRVAKVLVGRMLGRMAFLLFGLLALLAAWTLRHLNFPTQGVAPLPAGS